MFLPSSYGIMLSLALLVGYILARRRLLHRGISSDHIETLALIAAPTILTGARVHHVVTDWHLYEEHFVNIFYIWRGGLGFWGAFWAGVATVYIYSKKTGISAITILNGIAPYIFFVITIGRWGNIFNNELVPFAYYDSIANLALFTVVLIIEKQSHWARENLFLVALFLYAVIRFCLEFLRTEYRIAGLLTLNQVVCVVIVILTLFIAKNIIRGLLRRSISR